MKALAFPVALLAVIGLVVASLATGAGAVPWGRLWSDPAAWDVLLISRWPRTVALLLAGMAVSVSGLILQVLTRNRFVEPATAGTVPAASLGILVIGIVWPAAPVVIKMLVATGFSIAGLALFLLILRRLSLRSALLIPLVGIMLGAVLGAITTFVAVRYEMLQSLIAWLSGDFSVILRGRYEVLWLVGLLTAMVYLIANRLSIVGLGRDVAITLGLNYRSTMLFALMIVAMVNGVVTVVVGTLPFLGLIVPNLISLMKGDHIRRTIPWVCLLGSGITLLCDIAGRVIRAPYEIPAGALLGVFGAVVFLLVLLREPRHG